MAYYDFKDPNTVHIKYKDPIAAFYCQQFLDGEYIASLKANLIVKWIDHESTGLKRTQKLLSKIEEAKEEETSPVRLQHEPRNHTQTRPRRDPPSHSIEEEKEPSSRHRRGEHPKQVENPQEDTQSKTGIVHENQEIPTQTSSNWFSLETPTHTMFYKEAISDLSQDTEPKQEGSIRPTQFGSPPFNSLGFSAFGTSMPQPGKHNHVTKPCLGKPDEEITDEATVKRCYFELQIEGDKEFNVKSRLMGAMGCNMKRIEEKCNIDTKDSVKLQFVTKDLTKESEGEEDDDDDESFKAVRPNQLLDPYFDPDNSSKKVYLMVKSRNYQDYTKAVTLVQELLINVYEDYKRYCEKLKKKPI